MRVSKLSLLLLLLGAASAGAQIAPQTVQPTETFQGPGENYFISVSRGAGRIFDATTGEMHGLINVSQMTPAIQPNDARREFYATNLFWSRGNYGERTELLIVHDYENLAPIAEIELPPKSMIINFRNYIGLLSGGRHVASSNMTPAQSVSITDIVDREFVGEISTPGCSLILPVENNDFLTICGDGTLMLVQVDDNGNESNRVRSPQFFDLQEDAVYDRPVPTNDGWQLFTHGGTAMHATVDGDDIEIGDAWEMVTEEERAEGWWPGGGQLATLHKDLGLFYIVMHQGERYSHHEPGNQVWVFSTQSRRKIATIEFENPIDNIMVTQEAEPRLIVGEAGGFGQGGGETHVYGALTFKYERTIEGASASLYEDF
jgi:methylamine dehydrogenase heavy chain